MFHFDKFDDDLTITYYYIIVINVNMKIKSNFKN